MAQTDNTPLRLLISCGITLLLSATIAGAQTHETSNILYFGLNAPTLNAAARHTADALLSRHKISKDQKLLLYGYADYLGSRAHNDSLSTDRAMNVRAYLISKGIPESNISICVGKGAIERTPTTGHTGYAKDRKVEIITDVAKMKTLTCQPLAHCAVYNWSKNVSRLNVHAVIEKGPRQSLSDKAVSVWLPNGDKYIGEIDKDGNKVSGGTYIWASGEKYRGDFKNDKKDGQGIYTWPNADKLDGTWQNDEAVAGTLTIPYSGVLFQSDGATHTDASYNGNLQYTGEFQNHMFNGQGMAVWPNGDRYDGLWHDDAIAGHGTYYWANGQRYEGDWKGNKMHGRGAIYSRTGQIMQQGIWENDVFKK